MKKLLVIPFCGLFGLSSCEKAPQASSGSNASPSATGAAGATASAAAEPAAAAAGSAPKTAASVEGTPKLAEKAAPKLSGKTLHFSAIPDHNETELMAKYEPVARYLESKLGMPVEYVPSSDYKASVDLFKNGEVLFAWFGGVSGCQARAAVPGARAIVQGDVDPEYKSYIIAHESTGLEKSDEFPIEIAGMSFTFGSESSTSGRVMPEFFIKEETGQSVGEFFKDYPGFSGSHDKTIDFVNSGGVEVGAVNYKTYDGMVKDGKIDPEVCRVIWVTPDYADYNLTAHPDLDKVYGEGTIDKLQAALIALDDPALLKAFDRDALISAKNEDFDAIEAISRNLGFVR